MIVLMQWFRCSCSAVAGFYHSWVTGEGTRDASESNSGFHQGAWGSYCCDQSIFLGFPLCSCRSLFYRNFLFVFCGSHGLWLEHSANPCSWGMDTSWFLLFFFFLSFYFFYEMALWVWRSSFNILTWTEENRKDWVLREREVMWNSVISTHNQNLIRYRISKSGMLSSPTSNWTWLLLLLLQPSVDNNVPYKSSLKSQPLHPLKH